MKQLTSIERKVVEQAQARTRPSLAISLLSQLVLLAGYYLFWTAWVMGGSPDGQRGLATFFGVGLLFMRLLVCMMLSSLYIPVRTGVQVVRQLTRFKQKIVNVTITIPECRQWGGDVTRIIFNVLGVAQIRPSCIRRFGRAIGLLNDGVMIGLYVAAEWWMHAVVYSGLAIIARVLLILIRDGAEEYLTTIPEEVWEQLLQRLEHAEIA